MFKIGDKVRIKSWEQMKDDFGLDKKFNIKCRYIFTNEMRYLCGSRIIIEEVDYNRGLIQVVDNFNISFDMIESFDNLIVDSKKRKIYKVDET
jgi:hypothetical protein